MSLSPKVYSEDTSRSTTLWIWLKTTPRQLLPRIVPNESHDATFYQLKSDIDMEISK
jgi:hypothetical protein